MGLSAKRLTVFCDFGDSMAVRMVGRQDFSAMKCLPDTKSVRPAKISMTNPSTPASPSGNASGNASGVPASAPPEANAARSFWPTSLAGWALVVGLAVWFVNWVVSAQRSLGETPWWKTLLDLASLGAVVPVLYWLYRGMRWVLERLLWRLRRRLLVTWFLIGFLPLCLLLLLAVMFGYILLSQTNVNLARRQLDVYLAESRAATQALSQELNAKPANPAALVQTRATILEPLFPQLKLSLLPVANAPAWLSKQREFHGIVLEKAPPRQRLLFAYHFIQLNTPERQAVLLKYPLSGLCEHLSESVGVTVAPGFALIGVTPAPGEGGDLVELQAEPTPQAELSGLPVFAPLHDWESGLRMEGEVLRLDTAFLRPSQIWQRVQQVRTGSRIGAVMFGLITFVVGSFALVGMLAITSAMVLTRSITGTVHYLYQGTKRVEAGDLTHEIRAVSNDQLGELAHSFNRMIHSIRDLLRVSADKERLDQEMKIAAQVQARLFPRALPMTKLLDFAPGVCLPARQVSGDYFDFLEVAPGVTGVVIADVCGKGVSAALLMANLQAILRSQVQACPETQPQLRSLAQIVAHVNQRLKASAPDASYVTLCYAEFDEASSTLRYTNAGHNPPLLWHGNGEIERLETGGMVVGLFAEAEYEQAALRMYSGDLFIAFTDGLLEAHNAEGEEFGEERICEVVQRHAQHDAEIVKQALLAAVRDWTNGIEQEDDLTLVVFKRL